MVLQVGGVTVSGCGSAGNLGWLFSLCFMLGTRLPSVGCHGDARSRFRASVNVWSINITLVKTSHMIKAQVRGQASTLFSSLGHGEDVGMCYCHRGVQKWSLHCTHVAQCDHQWENDTLLPSAHSTAYVEEPEIQTCLGTWRLQAAPGGGDGSD